MTADGSPQALALTSTPVTDAGANHRTARLVAIVAGLLGALFAIATPLLPVTQTEMRLVFRRPPEYEILPDYDLRRQYLVMQRLAASPIPVPTVIMTIESSACRATPNRNSAQAATLASFSSTVGRPTALAT